LVNLVGFAIEIYYDAWPYEHQMAFEVAASAARDAAKCCDPDCQHDSRQQQEGKQLQQHLSE